MLVLLLGGQGELQRVLIAIDGVSGVVSWVCKARNGVQAAAVGSRIGEGDPAGRIAAGEGEKEERRKAEAGLSTASSS